MNKDKQIEEMASIIGDCKNIPDEICDKHLKCAECKASRCYNAGYRKASEVAREIFEEIEEKCFDPEENFFFISPTEFAELKKKYTEGKDGRREEQQWNITN